MDDTYLSNSDADIDLESGGNTSEEDGSKNCSLIAENTNKLRRVGSGFLCMDLTKKFTREGKCSSLCENLSVPGEVIFDNIKRKDKRLENMINSKDKRSAKNSIKPSKPPRPPRGPSLDDAADLKLVREISKMAMLKRQRVERMNAMKKMKNEKLSFINSSNFIAMAVTVIFFVVIVCQGLLGSRA